jgi:murein DD-endopeptidase MepM/ murein hydrolase activator NlpD
MTDLLNRVEYVNRIAESDKQLVAKLQETENLIGEKLDEVNKSKREMVFLSGQYELKHADLESAKQKKAQLVEKLSADEALYLQQIKDLEEDSNRIEKLIMDAEAEMARKLAEERARAVSVYQGGKISWPVPSSGNITSPYGNRIHPINGRTEFHTGIDISANYGADIVAAEGGVVLSAGWNGGYGNTVVINHGNGLSTLYAHGSKLVVSAGENVTKGQVIAKAGSTGYSTGNHLHFEVRLSGKHTNPVSYVKG